MIEFRDVHKRFGQLHVLRGINLIVREGEVVVLIGPSGAGKSTLLRCVNFLEPFDEGLVLVAGEPVGVLEIGGRRVRDAPKHIRAVRRQIGMVFQQFNLFPHMTALENVLAAPINVRHLTRKAAEKKALELLAKVGVVDKAHAFPSALSGGQQQRVAIARALAMDPKVMLFDEATSALDPELIGDVLNVMRQLAKEGMTMLIVTHEMDFARDVADRISFMADGLILEEGNPEVFFAAPKLERTRTFLSRILDRRPVSETTAAGGME